MGLGFIRKFIQTIQSRQLVRATLINSGWMMADRITRLIGGLFIGLWVARYLTPHHFGVMSTVIALNGIGLTLAGLGIDPIITRFFVKYPSHESTILGTAVGLRVIVSLAIGLMTLCIPLFFDYPFLSIWVWVLMGLTVIASALNNIKHWYDSRVQSKYIIWVELIGFTISAVLKLWGIFHLYTVDWFISVTLIEVLISLAGYWFIYQKHRLSVRWTFSVRIARLLLKLSLPMLVTSAAVLIYMKIDQIMVQSISGETAAGLYAAAARLSELTYFIPMIILTATLPGLTKLREINRHRYHNQLQLLLSASTLFAYVAIGIISILAPLIVVTLYGAAYKTAAAIVTVHIWSLVWICQGAIGYIFTVNAKLTRYVLLKDVVAATMNVGLNFLLIPKWGGFGAGIATTISYSFTAFWGNAIIPRLRPLFKMQIKSLYLSGVWSKLKIEA